MKITIDLSHHKNCRWLIAKEKGGGFVPIENLGEAVGTRISIEVDGGEIIVKEKQNIYLVYQADLKRGLMPIGKMNEEALQEYATKNELNTDFINKGVVKNEPVENQKPKEKQTLLEELEQVFCA